MALKTTKGTVTVKLRNDEGTREVDAYLAGGLAIHRDAVDGRWRVTHVASGLAVVFTVYGGRGKGTLKHARALVAELLATDIDWTLPASEVATKENARIVTAAANAVREAA